MNKNKYSRGKNTYKFDIHDYNLVDEIYHALKANDRIIFVSRHAERGLDYGKYGGLLPSGVKQAKDLGKRLSGGKLKDTKTDFYGSTLYKRTVETSFYLGASRGYKSFIEKKELKEDWEDFNQVKHPIREVYEYYFGEETEHRYEENRVEGNKKSLKMLANLCELTEGHNFSWITTHDVFLMPLLSWLSEENIKFNKTEWINYLSGVAVIVHKNNEYEVYPFRSLKDRSMTYIDS